MTTANATFDAPVAFDYRRIDLENWADVYVVGDVHGCLEELEQLLSELELGEDDLAIFVGDLVRKGPESRAVLDRVSSSRHTSETGECPRSQTDRSKVAVVPFAERRPIDFRGFVDEREIVERALGEPEQRPIERRPVGGESVGLVPFVTRRV